jgi:aspartate aminotransferase
LDKITLSNRVQRVKPSPTLSVTARVAELRAAGKDIIGLGAGEPDFNTPEHIGAAAIEAIRSGFTRYTAVDGTPELKQAIIAKFKRDNGLDYAPEQILVSCGGKQSFFNLCQALLNPGDEVIIPAPYWVSYPDMVRLADGEPVIIRAGVETGFKITPEQLQAAITPRTRLFVINSPSNPTGVAYTRAELAALGNVLKHAPQVLIATDDMYEHILWGAEPFSNILNPCPELTARTIVLNGVSKVYAMTGWRIGYAGVRHDGLAHRLRRRTGGPDQVHEENPVPEHLQPDLDLAGCGTGSAGGRPVLHRTHAEGIQGTTRFRGHGAE